MARPDQPRRRTGPETADSPASRPARPFGRSRDRQHSAGAARALAVTRITSTDSRRGYHAPLVQFHHAAEEDTMADKNTGAEEDKWWEQKFSSRRSASGRTYSDYRPAYQYGYESGRHNMGRNWNDVESDLRTGWDKYEGRGQSTWDHVKDAVRDAWDRITGQHDVDADRMSESNVGRTSRNF
jgi:hypothetical protein